MGIKTLAQNISDHTRTRYPMGIEILTSQIAAGQWITPRLRKALDDPGVGSNIWNLNWETSGGAQLYWMRGLAIKKHAIRHTLTLLKLLANQYPRTEIVIYPRIENPGKAWKELKDQVDAPAYSQKNWQTRDKARVWLFANAPTTQQWINGLGGALTIPPVTIVEKNIGV